MALFKIFKGLKNNLPKTYKDGYCYFTTDDGKMYIDTKDNNSAGRIVLNAEKADKLSSSRKITLSGNLQGSFNFDGSSNVTAPVTVIGAKMTDHLWLTGADANSSTASSSQIIFGTEDDNHIVISSNNDALVINPTASTTTNQIVLYLNQPSVFPSGIQTNIYGNASTATKLGTSTIGGIDRPIYLNAGSATASTYRMAATNTLATSALSIANDLPTGIWYVNGTSEVSDFNQADGVCIANQYSDKWITEIYQDYRTGQLAIRGKNNGTWQPWRKVLDSTNYTNYAPTKTGDGASGTWGINITGNAATATKATQDGNGNVITSKYVTLDTNQTISGIKTMSAALNLANGTWNKAGDDAYFGDNNTAGSFAIKGINGATNIKMVTYGDAADTNYGSITWSGNNFIFDKKIQIGNSAQSGMTQAVGIQVHDLRNATITPNSFGDQSINFIFDNRLGTDDWRSAIQIKGWTANYAAWQLSGGAGTVVSNKLYYREGTGSTWGSWYSIPFENRVNTFTELNTFSTGDKKGVQIGAAYITAESAQNGEIVLQNGHLRFGPSDWNYNVWGGLACNGYGTIALGLADNVYFKANTVQTGGTLTLPGIHYLVINDKEALAAYDSWLRINEDLAFSSGIYFGTSLVRTDSQFQVGSGGSAFYANNSGNVYASNAIGAGGRIYTGYDSGVTNSISCSNWFRASGETGLYNASYGLHLMPNLISDYTGWRVSGVRGGYHGILVGDAKTSMAIMSIDNSHQGLYTQTGTGWIIYNKNDSGQIGIRTSTLTPEYNITLGGTTSIVGRLYMNNNNITGVNNLQFSDPGVQEGITWADGNGWWIYESPDNLSNAAGNLQFVHGSTRRLTIRTDGYIDANAHLLANNGLTWTNAYWTAPGNIICNKNGTSVEFSFDMGAETQWHVWSTPQGRSILSCWADNSHVQVPIHLYVGNYNNTSYALSTSSFICESWIRTTGSTGWYNETHGGGWYMTDGTYIRTYNNKAVLANNSYYIGTTAGAGTGLSLYGTSDPNSYGIHMSLTSNYGKHGFVQGDWANYFCFDGAINRGWIFKQAGTNVASISGTGGAKFDNTVFGYAYTRSNNKAAFMWDKPGSNYTGVGANGNADTIYFGACSADGEWITSYKQQWIFNGQVTSNGKALVGSYEASAKTIPALVEELRYSNGAMGSVELSTAYDTSNGGTINAGWYNFIYSPHRSGGLNGAANRDNHNYGTLILSSMNNDNRTWIITISGGSILRSRRMWCSGDSVRGAVWNDYAECRESDCGDSGYVLMEAGDDSLIKTTERLSHFAGISSDTYGFSQGETDKAKTPIAVAGRVLAYPYQNRDNYKPGDCVCAAPGGTVDIMTREEIINWPDRIVGTVSCVPDYEEWGGGENADRPAVKVNGRIWIKVR